MRNGKLSIVITGGGFDLNGDPSPDIPDNDVWIDCQIKTNTNNQRGNYVDGTFQISKYEALIDLQPFDAKRIMLKRHDRDLGTFDVQDIQELRLVGKTKIFV